MALDCNSSKIAARMSLPAGEYETIMQVKSEEKKQKRADKGSKNVAARAANRGGRTAVRLTEEKALASWPDSSREAAANARTPQKAKRRGDDVRERVLKAALECFGVFGFEGTSTRAVAHRAEVTHTLVLYHFQSKEQLWIATMEDALTRYLGDIKQTLERSGEQSARAALSAFIEQFVRMSAQQPQIHRILTMESNQNTPRLEWVIEHYIRDHFNMIRDLIRRGQTEGTVRQCDPARLYYHIIGAAGTPFTISTEYKALTGRDVFSETEILRNLAFIYEIVFV